ncbi:MAG TPA: hypothetical protein VL357_07685 [Rariglobus sp.]|nr:hypothetical protein [Rariglobus sp.]
MALTRRLGLLFKGLFELLDFIAVTGGVFETLGFDRLVQIGFEAVEAVMESFAFKGLLRHLAGVRGALVHIVKHRLDEGRKCFVALGASEAPVLLEVILRETALLATRIRCRVLGIERRLEQKIRERKTAGIGDPLGLGARFAQIDLMHLIIHDLREVHGRLVTAEITFKRTGHDIKLARHPKKFDPEDENL